MNTVAFATSGAVTTVTLKRPAALNAMSEDMAREFAACMKSVSREPSKVVVLEGEGTAFSAGGDLDFIEANRGRPKAKLPAIMRRFYSDFLSVRDLPQVTIAKIHGPAVGAGLCLALACDLRVALTTAKLGFNFVRLGINPGMAAWPLARAAFGDARARELLMTGHFFNGADLRAWGASSAASATLEELDRTCAAMAAEISESSGASLRILKAETRLRENLSPFLGHEARGQAETFLGPDLAAGLRKIRTRS
jgi:enoyl-CoA hydratase/carnithine racemase